MKGPLSGRFRVLKVDADGTAELQSLELVHKAKSRGFGHGNSTDTMVMGALGVQALGTAAWCRPDRQVEKGDVVSGRFEFDPAESFTRSRLPQFAVQQEAAK